METLHPAETSHAYRVFYFHRTKSFHANGGQTLMARLLPSALKSPARRSSVDALNVSLLRKMVVRQMWRGSILRRSTVEMATRCHFDSDG